MIVAGAIFKRHCPFHQGIPTKLQLERDIVWVVDATHDATFAGNLDVAI
jgi:hypothetical protein